MNFSVLISVYCKEKPDYLRQSLQSIWENQTLKPSEIVLVKDGPLNDGLENVISGYKIIAPIKIITLAKNRGLGLALREGLANCSYELIIRMDSDDISTPERFAEQINFMINNPSISATSGIIREFNTVPNDLSRQRQLPQTYKQLRSFAKRRNPLNHPAVIFRKTEVEYVGSYEDVPFFEDYYLWVKLLNSGFKIANQDILLLHFRVGHNQIGRRHGYSYIQKEKRFFKKIFDLGFISRLDYYKTITLRLPVRLFPKSVLIMVYKIFLRCSYLAG
jgi:glycosyltransferase involved in cell wall biosynthesis